VDKPAERALHDASGSECQIHSTTEVSFSDNFQFHRDKSGLVRCKGMWWLGPPH